MRDRSWSFVVLLAILNKYIKDFILETKFFQKGDF